MYQRILLFVLSIWFCNFASAEQLKLVNVTLITSEHPIEPSGLASCGDKILLISDKYDEVFWLKPGDSESKAELFFRLTAPPLPLPEFQRLKDELKQKLRETVTKFTFDWEAISCDNNGHVYIGSERNTNILQLTLPGTSETGKTVAGQWILNGFDAYAKQQHFFEIFNAGMESMTWYPGGFIIAAERSPRGLFDVAIDASGQWKAKNMAKILSNGLPLIAPSSKKPDFADVYVENNKIYTLERYTGAVCRRSMQTFEQEKCWTYAEVENDPKWVYKSHKYGLAEGLTRFQNHIYIATDNNLEAREAAPSDSRPELYQFQVPADWSE